MRSVNTKQRDRVLFGVLAVILLSITAAGFALFWRSAGSRGRLLLEYQASRTAAGLVERYMREGSIEPGGLPAEVLGFGVYTPEGSALAREGSAPAMVDPAALGDGRGESFLLHNSTLRLLRTLGGGPGPGGMGRGARRPESSMRQFFLLDYDASAYLADSRNRILLWSGAALAIAFLLFLLFIFYRRVRRYQLQEEHQRQLVQLGQAARTLVHEIRNPLGALRLQSAVLKKKLPAEYAASLSVVDEEVGRIAHLVQRIREFLQSPHGEPERIDCTKVVSGLGTRFPFPVQTRTPGESVIVHFDPMRLRSVLSNIIENAWESMETKEAVAVTLEADRTHARITIADRGSGIPDGDKAQIFDPFFTTKENGSGVGLAISRQFVEGAGGKIRVSDRPGGGTLFVVSIPRER